jgi:hypothetical protein
MAPRFLALSVAAALVGFMTDCGTYSGPQGVPFDAPEVIDAETGGACIPCDAGFAETGFEDGFQGDDVSTDDQCRGLHGPMGCLSSCGGKVAQVISVLECPGVVCQGTTVFALCSESSYSECSCTLPPGYRVIGTDGGPMGEGGSEAGSVDSGADSPLDASPDSTLDADVPCPTTQPTPGSTCSGGTGGVRGCTYEAGTCVCLGSGGWACT